MPTTSGEYEQSDFVAISCLTTLILARPRFLPQPSSPASSSAKPSSTNSRPPHSVSQSQPGSRSTSPHSLRSSHYLSSTARTPTNARSRIPVGSNSGSRISSRESSPGRTRRFIDRVLATVRSWMPTEWQRRRTAIILFQQCLSTEVQLDVDSDVSLSDWWLCRLLTS